MGTGTARSRRRGLALALLCTAQFVDVLDVNVVLVALPRIGAEFDARPTAVQWVVTAYVLAFGAALVPAGRVADVRGRRRVFRAGLVLFGAASLGCGLAPSLPLLVAARTVQGLGAAAIAPAALALVTTLFREPAARDRAVGVWTAVAAVGGSAGLVLGGVVTEYVGWRAAFLVNVPIAAAAVALAPRLLPVDGAGPRRGLDVPGALALLAGLVLVVRGLGAAEGGDLAGAAGFLLLGLGTLGLAALVERRARDPLLPPWLLRCPPLVGAMVVAAAVTAATSPAGVIAALYLQRVRQVGPVAAGLLLVPFSVAVVVGSAVAPAILRRVPARVGAALGLAVVAAGALVACGIRAGAGTGVLVGGLVLQGAGLGAASVAATGAGTTAVAADRRGLASGLMTAAAQIGTALGLGVALSVAGLVTEAASSLGPGALVAGYRAGMGTAALLAVLGAVLGLRLASRG